jgi:aspartate/methionine/tyrosine aminotransferase
MDFCCPSSRLYRRRDLVVAAMKGIEGVECAVPTGVLRLPGCKAGCSARRRLGEVVATDLDLCMYFSRRRVWRRCRSAFELDGHFRISYAASMPSWRRG